MGPQKRIEVCESISGSAKVPKRKKNYAFTVCMHLLRALNPIVSRDPREVVLLAPTTALNAAVKSHRHLKRKKQL